MSTTNELMEQAKCYTCLPPGFWQLLKLGLLKQILLTVNNMADTSVNGLMEAAKCYTCVPPGNWHLLELALLKSISDGGGVGGGGVLYGTTDPTDAPASGSGSYYNTTSGEFWVWNSATSSWDQLIA